MAQLLQNSTIAGKLIATKDDFQVVDALPSNPEPDTFYFVKE